MEATKTQEQLQEEARQIGEDAGISAAGWFFDGNTEREQYVAVLRGLMDGDPEVMDSLPCPDLSGEWADDPTPASVLAELGLEEDFDGADEVLSAWEEGAAQGVTQEIERVCRLQLNLATPDPLEDLRGPDFRLPTYADGGYPLYYLDQEGNTLCPKCASDSDYSSPVIAYGLHMEGPDISCDDCSKNIESAYGDPDAEEGAE